MSIDQLRETARPWLLALVLAHVAIASMVALATGASVWLAAIGAGALAGLAAAAAPRLVTSSAARCVFAVAAQGQVAVIVACLAGHPWQIDAHMYFFALMGLLAILVDIRAIVAGAALIAVHHLLLSFLTPFLVYPDEAGLGRTLLHAVVLIVETVGLSACIYALQGAMDQSARRQAEAEAAAADARQASADLEAASEERRRDREQMAEEMRGAFGMVVDAAVAGDFSKRVEIRFDDAVLSDLGAGLNRLLDTVEQGVNETGRVMNAVARGDLDQRMEGRFNGAFATLQDDIDRCVGAVAELVGRISVASDVVGRVAREAAGGAEDLAGRAERQAASLEETSAAMEAISGTVRDNADKAARADEQARSASARGREGGDVLAKAVAAMGEIEAGAGRIAEIISVIDGIAFQTNLLALNAAVEAARAGDAGKGFAVVASEVRSLAQRAAEAAGDIRGLIQQSTAQISEGVELTRRSGDALTGAVEAMALVTGSLEEIAAASRSQAEGVAEVETALKDADQLTQANAAVAGESVSHARMLTEQAEALESLIAIFQRDPTAHAA